MAQEEYLLALRWTRHIALQTMPRVRLSFFVLLLAMGSLWLAAELPWPTSFDYFTFRDVFLQFSGVLAIGCMSVSAWLSIRPRWPERPLQGLDKMYRLHKWLGIAALAFSIAHWWFVQGTRWMLRAGVLHRPARGPRPPPEVLGPVASWLQGLRGPAQSLGEWAFYAAVVLILLALFKRFPYRAFARTHKLMAPLYLLLGFHSVVLAKSAYWRQPVGWMLIAMLTVGSASAVLASSGRAGMRRRVRGTVESVRHYPALQVLETRVAFGKGWPGHDAGQFAFFTSHPQEGAHPYTIASAWDPEAATVTFITKALGDHTSRLHELVRPGMHVTVEGPYGSFDFSDAPRRQIWVAAGIGITPFLARMKQLAGTSSPVDVDLFVATSVEDAEAIDKLAATAAGAKVRLHLLVSHRHGRLDGERLRATVASWRDCSVWFCGPARFGDALKADLVEHGLPAGRFHQELFELR